MVTRLRSWDLSKDTMRDTAQQILDALVHAEGRLNAIQHPYEETDFTRIREAVLAGKAAGLSTEGRHS